jgi:hypothetical protein
LPSWPAKKGENQVDASEHEHAPQCSKSGNAVDSGGNRDYDLHSLQNRLTL